MLKISLKNKSIKWYKEIKRLEKKSQKSITKVKYTVMGNSEFEFYSCDKRNNEVQFRLLFTPLLKKTITRTYEGKKLDLVTNLIL